MIEKVVVQRRKGLKTLLGDVSQVWWGCDKGTIESTIEDDLLEGQDEAVDAVILDLPAIERIKRKACPCWRCSGFGSYDAGTCPTCSGTGVDGEEWAKLVKGESDAH